MALLLTVNCGEPISPANGTLGYYPHTREGITVTFQCNEGYVPSLIRISNCTALGQWIPPPEDHICNLVEGIATA